jgi:hypothetical protein
MDSVPTQEPAGSSLPDIHLDPPKQHSIPTVVYIFAGILVSAAGAYLFLDQGFTFNQSTADLGTPPEEKMEAMAAVKASAEAEGRPKLSREEKMQFLGILDSGEVTSSAVVTASTESTE